MVGPFTPSTPYGLSKRMREVIDSVGSKAYGTKGSPSFHSSKTPLTEKNPTSGKDPHLRTSASIEAIRTNGRGPSKIEITVAFLFKCPTGSQIEAEETAQEAALDLKESLQWSLPLLSCVQDYIPGPMLNGVYLPVSQKYTYILTRC